MKVLVTGAGGQVGSEMLRLAQDDFEVVGFDRHDLDITDAAQVGQRLDECAPEMLVNCAAYTAVDRAEDDPATAHRINAEAVGGLGRACRDRGIGIVHLSTDYVFDGTKDGPYLEEDVPNPLNVYGATKLAGEKSLRAATDRHLILRVSWVFGNTGRSFVDTMLRLAGERREISVVDDQIGTPCPAGEIASAVRRIAKVGATREDAWGTYHFATKPSLSWCQFARAIVDAGVETGLLASRPVVHAIPSSQWPAKALRPRNSNLASARLAETFNLEPPGWEPCLRTYVENLCHRR